MPKAESPLVVRNGDGFTFAPTRRVADYLRIGFLAALGRPSHRIAEEIGDGIDPGYVRVCLQRAGISPGKGNTWCQVPLTTLQRTWLNYRAEKAGMTPEEWLLAKLVEILQ